MRGGATPEKEADNPQNDVHHHSRQAGIKDPHSADAGDAYYIGDVYRTNGPGYGQPWNINTYVTTFHAFMISELLTLF